MELDYQTAIIGTGQFAIGYGFWRLAQYCSERFKQPIGRALLSWPCYALGFLFLSSAAFLIIWNMVGPLVMWFWSLIA
jgi:hypothetical protein